MTTKTWHWAASRQQEKLSCFWGKKTKFLVRWEEDKGRKHLLTELLSYSKSSHHFQAMLRFWNEKQTNRKCDKHWMRFCWAYQCFYFWLGLFYQADAPSQLNLELLDTSRDWTVFADSYFEPSTSTNGLKEKVSIVCEPWRIWDLLDVKAWTGIRHGSRQDASLLLPPKLQRRLDSLSSADQTNGIFRCLEQSIWALKMV